MEITPITPENKEKFRQAAQPAVRAFIVDEIGEAWPDRLDAAVADYRAAH